MKENVSGCFFSEHSVDFILQLSGENRCYVLRVVPALRARTACTGTSQHACPL